MEVDEIENKAGILRKEAESFNEKLSKRGVIYLSRVPPFMKPNKVKSYFEQYGEVTRLFLAEEDSSRRLKRKNNGGNASKQFHEGWIEFANKAVAKKVGTSLNGANIARKKSDFYHDDTWNLKYLKGFKWDYLTEKLAYERRVRESKLKAAFTQAKKLNAEFVELVEKQKVEDHIKKRKMSKPDTQSVESDSGKFADDAIENENKSAKKRQRLFFQKKPIAIALGNDDDKMDTSVLRKIFSHIDDND